jgi:hypothetical protein
MAVAFLGLDKQQIAHSSVVTRTAQQLGGSFGTAVLAVVLSGAIAARHGNLATGFDIAFWWAHRILCPRRAARALAPWRFTQNLEVSPTLRSLGRAGLAR